MAGVGSSMVDTRPLAPPGSPGREPFVLEALGLVPIAQQSEVERATRGFGLKLELLAVEDLAIARIESGCPDVLLIDADLVACPGQLCRFARSLRPDVAVFLLTWYWSERDDVLWRCADAILHKPPRYAEWEFVFRRCGVLRACQSDTARSTGAAIAQPALSAGERSFSHA